MMRRSSSFLPNLPFMPASERDYLPGDVLLKVSSSIIPHKVISKGQELLGNTNEDPDIVHSAFVGAYCPETEVPDLYEVVTSGLYFRKKSTNDVWLSYRWVTDFDTEYAHILSFEGGWEAFNENVVSVILQRLHNPFDEISLGELESIKALFLNTAIVLPDVFNAEMILNDESRLRAFIKACAIFQIREQVVFLAGEMLKSKEIEYDFRGAASAAILPVLRNAKITQTQIESLQATTASLSEKEKQTYYCSEFVVRIFGMALLKTLPEKLSLEAKQDLMPFALNLNVASPAEMRTFLKKAPQWKSILTKEEQYRLNLLKRIVNRVLTPAKPGTRLALLREKTQDADSAYDLCKALDSKTFNKTQKNQMVPLSHIFQERLLAWRVKLEPTTEKTSWLRAVEGLLSDDTKGLPSSEEELVERLLPDLTLANARGWLALLKGAARVRQEKAGSVSDVLQTAYIQPLAAFHAWSLRVNDYFKEQQPISYGLIKLFEGVIDYLREANQGFSLSEEGLLETKDGHPSLVLLESGLFAPLLQRWKGFVENAVPDQLVDLLRRWSDGVLKSFLMTRKSMLQRFPMTDPLFQVVSSYPDNTGFSVSSHLQKQLWQEKTAVLKSPEGKETGYHVKTVVEGEVRSFFLKESVGAALFKKGKLRIPKKGISSTRLQEGESSINDRHLVARHGGFYLKIPREEGLALFGHELAVHRLQESLGFNVLMPAALWQIAVKEKGKPEMLYSCWVSEDAGGDLLGDVMKQIPSRLSDIGRNSVTELFALTLLTSQEDGQPYNMVLRKEGGTTKLCVFDVGHAFVLPVLPSLSKRSKAKKNLKKNWASFSLELKSMVFLLPQMGEMLDELAQDVLTFLNIDACILSLQIKLKQENEAWANLFPTVAFGELIDLPKTAWPWIAVMLKGLQQRLQENALLSMQALFKKLLPTVASMYAPHQKKLLNIEDYLTFDFKDLNPRAYKEIVARTAGGALRTLTSSRRSDDIQRLQKQSVRRFGQRANLSASNRSMLDWRDNFNRDREVFSLLMLMMSSSLQEIDLTNNAFLRDSDLMIILSGSRGVKRLVLSGSHQLRQLPQKGHLKFSLKALEYLDVSHCEQLEKIHLRAPVLTSFFSVGSQKLKIIKLGPSFLEHIELDPAHEELKCEVSENSSLRMNLLRTHELFKNHPYLLNMPWSRFSDGLMDKLNYYIELALKKTGVITPRERYKGIIAYVVQAHLDWLMSIEDAINEHVSMKEEANFFFVRANFGFFNRYSDAFTLDLLAKSGGTKLVSDTRERPIHPFVNLRPRNNNVKKAFINYLNQTDSLDFSFAILLSKFVDPDIKKAAARALIRNSTSFGVAEDLPNYFSKLPDVVFSHPNYIHRYGVLESAFLAYHTRSTEKNKLVQTAIFDSLENDSEQSREAAKVLLTSLKLGKSFAEHLLGNLREENPANISKEKTELDDLFQKVNFEDKSLESCLKGVLETLPYLQKNDAASLLEKVSADEERCEDILTQASFSEWSSPKLSSLAFSLLLGVIKFIDKEKLKEAYLSGISSCFEKRSAYRQLGYEHLAKFINLCFQAKALGEDWFKDNFAKNCLLETLKKVSRSDQDVANAFCIALALLGIKDEEVKQNILDSPADGRVVVYALTRLGFIHEVMEFRRSEYQRLTANWERKKTRKPELGVLASLASKDEETRKIFLEALNDKESADVALRELLHLSKVDEAHFELPLIDALSKQELPENIQASTPFWRKGGNLVGEGLAGAKDKTLSIVTKPFLLFPT